MNTDNLADKLRQLRKKADCIAQQVLPPLLAEARDEHGVRAATDSEIAQAEYRLCASADSLHMPDAKKGTCVECKRAVLYDPMVPLGNQQLICIDCALGLDEGSVAE